MATKAKKVPSKRKVFRFSGFTVGEVDLTIKIASTYPAHLVMVERVLVDAVYPCYARCVVMGKVCRVWDIVEGNTTIEHKHTLRITVSAVLVDGKIGKPKVRICVYTGPTRHVDLSLGEKMFPQKEVLALAPAHHELMVLGDTEPLPENLATATSSRGSKLLGLVQKVCIALRLVPKPRLHCTARRTLLITDTTK